MEAGSSIKCQEREVKRDSVMQWRSIVICESWEIQQLSYISQMEETSLLLESLGFWPWLYCIFKNLQHNLYFGFEKICSTICIFGFKKSAAQFVFCVLKNLQHNLYFVFKRICSTICILGFKKSAAQFVYLQHILWYFCSTFWIQQISYFLNYLGKLKENLDKFH